MLPGVQSFALKGKHEAGATHVTDKSTMCREAMTTMNVNHSDKVTKAGEISELHQSQDTGGGHQRLLSLFHFTVLSHTGRCGRCVRGAPSVP